MTVSLFALFESNSQCCTRTNYLHRRQLLSTWAAVLFTLEVFLLFFNENDKQYPASIGPTLDINNHFLLTSKSHDLNMHLSWDSTHFAGVANLMLTIMLTIMVTQTNHGIIHKRYDIYTYACLFNNIFLMALGNKRMQDSIIFNPGLLCLSIYLFIIYICTI